MTAQEAGQLSVLGYTHTALGLTSECHLEESHALTVLPPLPLRALRCALGLLRRELLRRVLLCHNYATFLR